MNATSRFRDSPQARLFKYHPERFYLLRRSPEWEEAVTRKEQLASKEESYRLLSVTELLVDLLQERTGALVPESESVQFDTGRIEEAIRDDTSVGMAAELESVVVGWAENGNQIFDLSAIAVVFQDSDAHHVPLDQLPLPYNKFYLYWGRHLHIASPTPGRFMDGCYVHHHPELDEERRFSLTFTSSHIEDDPWDERSLVANIVLDSEGTTVLLGAFEQHGATIEDMLKGGLKANAVAHSMRWETYMSLAINMAANCLCYLAWEKREIRLGVPADAPTRLVKQLNSLKSTETRRAQSKLRALGFRTVHLCGEAQAIRLGLSKDSKTLPPGWRRGHWRHQRVGKGRREVKVLWIQPKSGS